MQGPADSLRIRRNAEVVIVSAVEKANKVMEAMGWQPSIGCSCGGYWWFTNGEPAGATHATDCPHADLPPPDIRTVNSQERAK